MRLELLFFRIGSTMQDDSDMLATAFAAITTVLLLQSHCVVTACRFIGLLFGNLI